MVHRWTRPWPQNETLGDQIRSTPLASTPIAPILCVWAFGTYTCLHTCFQSLKQPIEAGLSDVHARKRDFEDPPEDARHILQGEGEGPGDEISVPPR